MTAEPMLDALANHVPELDMIEKGILNEAESEKVLTQIDIETLLNQLAEYEAERDALELRKQAAIDSVLTDEIRAKISEIDAEFEPLRLPVDLNINGLTGRIKDAVIEHGSSVKGKFRQAVLTPSKIKVKYNVASLDGYAAAHPEILAFRTEEPTEPSVSIRVIK